MDWPERQPRFDVVWHFYSVHLRSFNRAMFTGQLTEHEMEHEHPLELARIKAGTAQPAHDPAALAKRQSVFLPVAGVVAALLLLALFFAREPLLGRHVRITWIWSR